MYKKYFWQFVARQGTDNPKRVYVFERPGGGVSLYEQDAHVLKAVVPGVHIEQVRDSRGDVMEQVTYATKDEAGPALEALVQAGFYLEPVVEVAAILDDLGY